MMRAVTAVAAVIAAAVLISAPFTAPREGLRTKPYRDPANIETVCYGETEREMRIYTPEECMVMLRARQTKDYAPGILHCVPAFADASHIHAFAASIDASYNAGIAAFCRSPMARAFRAGDWAKGCRAFVGWYETANRKKLKGLVLRRKAERDLCMKDGVSD